MNRGFNSTSTASECGGRMYRQARSICDVRRNVDYFDGRKRKVRPTVQGKKKESQVKRSNLILRVEGRDPKYRSK